MLYGFTCDYHWEQFDKNVTKKNIVGDWTKEEGLVSGLVGFGKAINLVDEQCMKDDRWAEPDANSSTGFDPCMGNPENCTDGLSYSIWENMVYSADVLEGSGGAKKYIVSTGGDFNPRNGKAWPGVAIYHQGLEVVAVVSTGTKVWELRVAGQLYNNTWSQIGIRFKFPDMSNPKWASMDEPGFEKMGGLEMWINAEKVGHSILAASTDRGSTMWTPLPALTHDGTPEGRPVVMIGCHQNSDMALTNEFSGFAGTKDFPAMIDELAVWRHRLEPYEVLFMLGGYSFDISNVNADQFGAMLGNVDLDDPEQADAAQKVLEAMLMGPPTTIPPFPTRTAEPTTTQSTTEKVGNRTMPPLVTEIPTEAPLVDNGALRRKILGRQGVMSTMLMADNTYNVQQDQDPELVEGRFALGSVASALLIASDDNIEQWNAVYEEPEHEGPQKTVKQLEEYMLAWVSSVNNSAYRADDPKWKTSYFDPTDDSMRYSTKADDFVLNVDKLPMAMIRGNEQVRMQYPDYSGWEWEEAIAKWENTQDNFSVPTGMYKDIPGCHENPMSILTAIYNGLPKISAPRRNPVTIKSADFFIDSKVISVRTKATSDPMVGDVTSVYHCEASQEYMKWNPVKLRLFHKQPAKAKRTLLWHTEDYWSGLEIRHCVWWNERFGTNGAWDTEGCVMTATDEEKSSCECSHLGSYAVLSEMLQAPDPNDSAFALIIIKWIGIIIGTILLAIFIGVVFVSVVVGEMFHQLRMYCCLAYLIANILSLIGDTSVCEDRHNNMAISMMLMYFYQAAITWNMCEAHATFKGITAGLINGRTSVYHPIAWGLPLICVGFLCQQYGELLGTHPNCFVSWENEVVEKFFYFNGLIFCITGSFCIVIISNIVRVQSHNRETVQYLKDQVKGHLLICGLMAIVWIPLGWLSYIKNPERNLPSMMPLFQVLNGWFGVILFLALGVWSKRFMLGLNAQAEEKKRMMEEKKRKMAGGGETDADPLGSPEDGKSLASNLNSPAASRPASAVATPPEGDNVPPEEEAPPPGSRPVTAGATGTSRPTSAQPEAPQDDAPEDALEETPEEETPEEAIP